MATRQRTRAASCMRGCGIVAAIWVLIIGGVVAWQWRTVSVLAANIAAVFEQPEFASGLDTAPALLPYLQHERDRISVVVATVDADGNLQASDAVQHNADTPVPLASTVKVVVLAAYAQAVEAGDLNPDERVAVREWERYYMPGTDGGAHPAALERLGIAATGDGLARDASATVSLDQLADVMIAQSDNAATDYLIERLGPQRLEQTIAVAGLRGQDVPLPISGIFLSWQNHEAPTLDAARVAALTAQGHAAYAAEVRRLAAQYADTPWGEEERRWLTQGAFRSSAVAQRSAAQATFPRGTASDYARMMGQIAHGTFLSPAVSATMQRHLNWPMQVGTNAERFSAFGAKGGSLPGILTDSLYVVPQSGDFAGDVRVSVVLMGEMSMSAWITLTQSFGQQQAIISAATDRAYLADMRAALEGTWTPTTSATSPAE